MVITVFSDENSDILQRALRGRGVVDAVAPGFWILFHLKIVQAHSEFSEDGVAQVFQFSLKNGGEERE
jgi:hypothetical protein